MHSASLDSISTAVSTGTEQQQKLLSHSSSMDNLIHKTSHHHHHHSSSHNPNPGSGGGSSGSKFMRRKDDRVYDTLVESASILTTFSDQIIQNPDARSDCTTQVLTSSANCAETGSGTRPQRHHEIRTEEGSGPANFPPCPTTTTTDSSANHRCHRSNSGSSHRKQEVGGFFLDTEEGRASHHHHPHHHHHRENLDSVSQNDLQVKKQRLYLSVV